jgi:hypothetical protein
VIETNLRKEGEMRKTNPQPRCSCIGVADGRSEDAPSAKNEEERILPCHGEKAILVIKELKSQLPEDQKMDANLRAKKADVH